MNLPNSNQSQKQTKRRTSSVRRIIRFTQVSQNSRDTKTWMTSLKSAVKLPDNGLPQSTVSHSTQVTATLVPNQLPFQRFRHAVPVSLQPESCLALATAVTRDECTGTTLPSACPPRKPRIRKLSTEHNRLAQVIECDSTSAIFHKQE